MEFLVRDLKKQEEKWPQRPAATKAFLVTKTVTWSQINYQTTKMVTMAKLHIWYCLIEPERLSRMAYCTPKNII